MSVIKSLVIAFSMYSKIPMPHLELEEKDMVVELLKKVKEFERM